MTTADELPIDQLVLRLGFVWPDDPTEQRAVLEKAARRALYWQARFVEVDVPNTKEAYRDRLNIHLRKRCVALAKRLRGVRRAAIEFKAGQVFDRFAATVGERDDLRARVAELTTRAV